MALPRGQARAPAWRRGDTWHILYLFYIVYITYTGLPIIGRQFTKHSVSVYVIYSRFSIISSVWDYFTSICFDFRPRGATSIVG